MANAGELLKVDVPRTNLGNVSVPTSRVWWPTRA